MITLICDFQLCHESVLHQKAVKTRQLISEDIYLQNKYSSNRNSLPINTSKRESITTILLLLRFVTIP